MAWRSPAASRTLSIGAFSGPAYGAVSLSSQYRNVAGYFVCVPGTVTNGMPIGPPSHRPAAKSAWKPRLAPIVFTIELELERIGSVSTGVFQMLLAGNTVQPPI